eukprot:4321292-Alexandrium_andersonii.AAC.1
MQKQLVMYMEKKGLTILALQETRTPTTTQFVVEGYLFILFGSGEKKEYAGVGYIVSLKLRTAIVAADNDGSRMAVLGIDTGPRKLWIFSVYAPHEERPEEERREFYDNLDMFLGKYRTAGVPIIIGDLNARIRRIQERGPLGPFHLRGIEPATQGGQETNEELLINFCAANELVLAGSFFRRRQELM